MAPRLLLFHVKDINIWQITSWQARGQKSSCSTNLCSFLHICDLGTTEAMSWVEGYDVIVMSVCWLMHCSPQELITWVMRVILKTMVTCRCPSSWLQLQIITWSHCFFFFGFCRIVLPGGEGPSTNQSRASTPSSGELCLFISLFCLTNRSDNAVVPLRTQDQSGLMEQSYFETWQCFLSVSIPRCSTRLWKRSK